MANKDYQKCDNSILVLMYLYVKCESVSDEMRNGTFATVLSDKHVKQQQQRPIRLDDQQLFCLQFINCLIHRVARLMCNSVQFK